MKNRRVCGVALLVALCFAWQGWADPLGATTKTNDSIWMAAHDLNVANINASTPDILFIGDSITDWWDRELPYGIHIWTNHYATRNAYNAGYQGDKVEDLRWRVENGLFSSSNDPKVVVMLIGANGYDASDTEEAKAQGMELIVDYILTNTVSSKVLLLTTFPKGVDYLVTNQGIIDGINAWDPKSRLTVLNINSNFIVNGTSLNTNLFVDSVHPNEQGYQVWYEQMEPTLADLLDSGPAIETSASSLTVAEGSTNSLTIRLAEMPENSATVTVSRLSGDSDLSVLSGSPAVFTTNNWDVWQTITLQAAEDVDTTDGSATFQCSGPSLTSAQITATEVDNDIAIQVSNSSLTVPEGSSANLLVRLNTAPAFDYTVSVSRVSGDTDLSVSSGAQLVFTTGNYMNWQTSVVAAAQDGDEANGSAIIRLSSAGADDVDVTVTEQDDDNTVVATGLLAAWNFDSASASAVVSSTNAYLMATGLLNNASAGAVKHSNPPEQRATANGLAAIDNDEPTLAEAITAGNYFYWQLQPQTNYVLTITQVVFRTECASTVVPALLCDASGLTASDVLATNGSSFQVTTADLSANTALANISTSVEFRVYGYAGSSQYDRINMGHTYRTDGLDDIQIYGTVTYSAPGDPDDDSDGIPNWWEEQHYGGTTNANPTNLTANGINTVEEAYIAGLNPTNPSSFFKIADLQGDILQWTSVSGRVYSVEWSTNLINGFQTLETNLTGGAFTDSVHQTEDSIFYRINVYLEK